MLDIVIRNGRIVDGSGNPWYNGDVGIQDGRVVALGALSASAGDMVIDATDRVVCPGFIDTHTHSDLVLLIEPLHEPGIRQGITTEVLGQDGRSLAPITEKNTGWVQRGNSWTTADFSWNWKSMAELRSRYDGSVAINTVQLIGYRTICRAVMGEDSRVGTPAELEAMKALVAQAMEEGAVGLSTALEGGDAYDTDQLVALCKVVARYGGVYVTHRRQAYDELNHGGIREGIEIGERSGAAVHFSHFKSGHGHDLTRGRSMQMLAMVDAARARGVDVTVESYPYIAGSSGLDSLLQHWVTKGKPEEVMARLKDTAVRDRIRAELAHMDEGPLPDFCYGWPDYASAYLSFTAVAEYKPYEGKSMTEIAVLLGRDPVDTICDILIADGMKTKIVHFGTIKPEALEQMEQDVRNIMRHPAHMVGSDSSRAGTKPHPRAYGCLPRYLGTYCRELGVLTLENTIRKMTSLPAQRFGLHDRGVLKYGMAADVVVFDPKTVADKATYQEPRQFPVGIDYVLVNGKPAIANGKPTGILNGKAVPVR